MAAQDTNTETRDVTNIQYVSISQLNPIATELVGDPAKLSLVEIENYVRNGQYQSGNMNLSTLAKTLLRSSGLSAEMKTVWGLGENTNVSAYNDFYASLSGKLKATGDNLSATGIIINGSSVATESTISTKLMTDNKLSFKSSGENFYSVFESLENNSAKLSVETLDGAPTVEGEEHNRYIFKVVRHQSNEYTTTNAGWFTCYGWISEKETYIPGTTGRQDNASRWVALEAYIDNNWRIIQLQPFEPNNYCSYVGFGVPVCNNLKLRITTGFDVGSNSGKYSNKQGSLTNHIPNAFIGGVYCYA